MSDFLIDTPSEATELRPDPRVEAWIAAPGGRLYVSVVTLGELRKGITLLPTDDGRRQRLERWFELEAERQMRGRPLSSTDGQIAATALEHGLTLVTRNINDFDGLGLDIVNPWAA